MTQTVTIMQKCVISLILLVNCRPCSEKDFENFSDNISQSPCSWELGQFSPMNSGYVGRILTEIIMLRNKVAGWLEKGIILIEFTGVFI